MALCSGRPGSTATTVALCRADLDEAFRDPFDYVLHVLGRLGMRQHDLEDVTQEVFLAVHRHFTRYDPERSLRPWLCAFAARTARSYRLLARHRLHLVEDVDALADSRAIELELDEREARAFVLRALERLVAERGLLSIMPRDRRSARRRVRRHPGVSPSTPRIRGCASPVRSSSTPRAGSCTRERDPAVTTVPCASAVASKLESPLFLRGPLEGEEAR